MSVFQFLKAADKVRARLNASIAHVAGISFAEYQLLDAVRQSPGGAMTRVDLAQAVGLTASGVSRALKPLEKIGMVESVKAERDARQTLAKLTAAGSETLNNCDSCLAETIQAMPQLPASAHAIEAFIGALSQRQPRVWQHKTNGAFLA